MIVRDPGLQPERTVMAWARTGIAMVVNAALVARIGVMERSPAITAAGLLMAGLALALLALAARRRRQLLVAHPPAVPAGFMLFVGGAAVFAAACGAWAVS